MESPRDGQLKPNCPRPLRAWQFSLLHLLAITTIVAICVAVSVKAFFIGMWCVVGSVLLIAWYARTCELINQWDAKDRDRGWNNPLAVILAAAISLPIAAAAAIAFGVTCTGVGYGAGVVMYEPSYGFDVPFILIVVLFAIPMGCIAAAAFLRLTWPRYK
jgi:hypothetical protein